MKLFTVLAFVVTISGIFLNSGRSEETSKIDSVKESSPENVVTYDESDELVDDNFKSEASENDDDVDGDDDNDENTDEQKTDDDSESNLLSTRTNTVESNEAASKTEDRPELFKRNPLFGRRRRRRRRRFFRIRLRKIGRKLKKVGKKIVKGAKKLIVKGAKKLVRKLCTLVRASPGVHPIFKWKCKIISTLGDEETTSVQMDAVRPETVLHEFEEDVSESDYAIIQEDQTSKTNETPGH